MRKRGGAFHREVISMGTDRDKRMMSLENLRMNFPRRIF